LAVSEVNQKIDIKLWYLHEWQDDRLSWNPAEYGNIKYLHIPSDNLWKPDLAIYNNADGDFIIMETVRAKVSHTGSVVWKPPIIAKTFCEMLVADFPFDTQNCTMKIGTWTHSQFHIDIVSFDDAFNELTCCEEGDLSAYEQNGEWELLRTGCWKHYVKYDCCDEIYLDTTFHVILKRRPLYLILNIVFPTILFSLLSCAVFYLPADECEKITLCISVLLSLVVFLLVIVDTIPPTASAVPMLGIYILFTMALNSFSIVLTVVVENVHHRGPETHEMPQWMRKIFIDFLPRVLFPSTMKTLSPHGPEEPTMDGIFKGTQRYRQIAKLAGEDDSSDPLLLNSDVRRAIMGVEYMAKSFKEEEYYNRSRAEWKYVAFVLDQLLLYVFIATCLLGSIAIFGSNSIDLLMAAWQTKKRDSYMDEKNIYPNQDICFSYFSEDDMEIVLAEQEYQRELKQLQDEANWELTDRD